jgi:hypothetical protein
MWLDMEHHVLLLGAGVQSTAVFLLMREGGIKVPESLVAIFADTQEEPAAVYKHVDWLRSLEWPAIWVRTAGRLGDALLGARTMKKGSTSIPAYTRTAGAAERTGVVRRNCTNDFKIEVIDGAIRSELLGLKHHQRRPREVVVHQYFGISRDEARRAVSIQKRADEEKFVVHFPLLEMGWTRGDCMRFLAHRVPHPVPRSACVFCPFRNDREWQELKQSDPEGWGRAVAIDRALRTEGTAVKRGMRDEMYLHWSVRPLEEVRFDAQAAFPGFSKECDGMCGV